MKSFYYRTEKFKNCFIIEQFMDPFDIFEEWDTYAKKKLLTNRNVDLKAFINNSKLKIVALTGIRRSGKTSLLMLLAQTLTSQGKHVCYINLEDNRLQNRDNVLDETIKWFGDKGFMLLDEITAIPGWEGWLARTHELLKGQLYLIISSSRKSIASPTRPLRGRMLPYELYPLSFQEFLNFLHISLEKTTSARGKREKTFELYQQYGGYPEITLTKPPIEKVSILNSYFRDIIALDVAEMAHEDISVVDIFGRYVIQSPYFSASKCLNYYKTLGYKIGKEKILYLEQYAQAAYLFFFVPIFSYKIKDRTQYPRKAYCGDVGFKYSTLGKIDKGRVYENLVYLELRRRTQGQYDICYWKNKEGLETDFIVKQGSDIKELIQVVYDLESGDTRKREINGIVSCAKELNINKGTIVTNTVVGTQTIENIKITFVPLMQWLLQTKR